MSLLSQIFGDKLATVLLPKDNDKNIYHPNITNLKHRQIRQHFVTKGSVTKYLPVNGYYFSVSNFSGAFLKICHLIITENFQFQNYFGNEQRLFFSVKNIYSQNFRYF